MRTLVLYGAMTDDLGAIPVAGETDQDLHDWRAWFARQDGIVTEESIVSFGGHELIYVEATAEAPGIFGLVVHEIEPGEVHFADDIDYDYRNDGEEVWEELQAHAEENDGKLCEGNLMLIVVS